MAPPRPARSGPWREPLLWFLLVGAVLFALDRSTAGGATEGNRATEARPSLPDRTRLREDLRATLRNRLGREPTEGELSAQVDRVLREAVLAEEARALGLGRTDPQVRKRLAELMVMQLEAEHPPPEPTDEQLRRWYDTHRDRYAPPPRIALRLCRLPAEAVAEAATWRKRLDAGEQPPCAPVIPPPPEGEAPLGQWLETLGPALRETLLGDPEGRWIGPVRTPAGTLLLRIERRVPVPAPPLSAVRERVRRDWLARRRAELRERAIQRLVATRLGERPPEEH